MNLLTILLWLIIIGSSIWVLIDAKDIGIKKGQISGIGNMGPVEWFVVCLLLWIIGFPLYLAKRGQYKRINGKASGSVVATVVGLGLIALQVLVIIMMFAGNIKMSTSDLQGDVRKSIEETWVKEPSLASASIQSFVLIHKAGNQYEGLLEVTINGVTEKIVVDVTYDGKQFMWQVRQMEEERIQKPLISEEGYRADVATTLAGPDQSSTAEKSVPAELIDPKESTIKIKGLYIGMDIQTVPSVLKEKLPPNTFNISDLAKVEGKPYTIYPKKGSSYIVISLPGYVDPVLGLDLSMSFVSAEPEGKVILIALSPVVVEKIFSAEDMDASDFSQTFVDSYHIPKITPTDDMQAWTYTSPDGVKVTIGTDKQLTIEKVPSQKERKQAFD